MYVCMHNSLIRSDEGLTLVTSASESLYCGQFTLPTQLIKTNYLNIRRYLQNFQFPKILEQFIRNNFYEIVL